jgi:xylono-1,5-lactonase
VQTEASFVTPEVQLAWHLDAQLGEGPAWFVDEQVLRFVDIKRGNLHVFDPLTQARQTHALGDSPSFILPEVGGGLLVGSRQSVWRLSGNRYGEEIARLSEPEHNRTNDATVDASGRLWLGTMDDDEQRRSGAVWCFDKGELTNGPAVSPDGRWIYHVDSAEQTIWRFPLRPEPQLAGGEKFITVDQGFPDGIVVDSLGNLWVALWDGWAVRHYDSGGNLLFEVPMPCARVTKLALGGADLCTAYVTTARIGLTPQDLTEQPLAGSLFCFRAGVAGQELPAVQHWPALGPARNC